MMLWIGLSIAAFVATGGIALYRKRAKYAAAMTEDGFRPHEIRKALRLLDRGGPVAMEAYCREVMERRSTVTQRDWSKIDAYGFDGGIGASSFNGGSIDADR